MPLLVAMRASKSTADSANVIIKWANLDLVRLHLPFFWTMRSLIKGIARCSNIDFFAHKNELSNIWDKLEHSESESRRMKKNQLIPILRACHQGSRFLCVAVGKRREGESFDLLINESIFVPGDSSDVSVCEIFLSGCHNIELLRGSWQTVRGKKILLRDGNFTHRLTIIKSWTWLWHQPFFRHFITQQLDIKRYNKGGKSVPFYVHSRSFNMETSCYFCDVSKLRGKSTFYHRACSRRPICNRREVPNYYFKKQFQSSLILLTLCPFKRIQCRKNV